MALHSRYKIVGSKLGAIASDCHDKQFWEATHQNVHALEVQMTPMATEQWPTVGAQLIKAVGGRDHQKGRWHGSVCQGIESQSAKIFSNEICVVVHLL